jgi:hypothetical protein
MSHSIRNYRFVFIFIFISSFIEPTFCANNDTILETLTNRIQVIEANIKQIDSQFNILRNDPNSDMRIENDEKVRLSVILYYEYLQEKGKILKELVQLSKSEGADKKAIAQTIALGLTNDFTLEMGGGMSHDTLAEIGEEGLELLIQAYSGSDEKHKDMVKTAIRRVNDPNCMGRLKAIYYDPGHNELHSSALTALTNLYKADPNSIELLLREAACDPNSTLRQHAVYELTRISPEAAKKLLEERVADSTENSEFKVWASLRLENYYPQRRIERILTELSQPELDSNQRESIYSAYLYTTLSERDENTIIQNIDRFKPFLKLTRDQNGTPDSRSRVGIWRIIYKATGEMLPLELAYDDDEERDHLIYNMVDDVARPYQGSGIDGRALARQQILPLITRWKPLEFDEKDLDLLLKASLTADELKLDRITTAIMKINDSKWSERLISAYSDIRFAKIKIPILYALDNILNQHNIAALETFITQISRDRKENDHLRHTAMTMISNYHISFNFQGNGLIIQPYLEAYLAGFAQDSNESEEIKVEACNNLIRYFPGKYENVAIAWYGDPKASYNFRFRLAHSVFYEFNPKWVQENLNQLIPLMKVTLPNGPPDNRGRAYIWTVIYNATKKEFPLELNPKDKDAYDDAIHSMVMTVIGAMPREKTTMTEDDAKKRIDGSIILWKQD